MEKRIQLTHPAGKKAITMDPQKYEVLRKAVLEQLKKGGEMTHKELYQMVSDGLQKKKVRFEGSVEWHMEWVKLDLEAKKEIMRVGSGSPVKFAIRK